MKTYTPHELAAAVLPTLDEMTVIAGLVHHDAKDQVHKVNDTVSMEDLETDTFLDDIFWSECFIDRQTLEMESPRDIVHTYLMPMARCVTRGVDLLLFEYLSRAITGRSGPFRTNTLRQASAEVCLRFACEHFDMKEVPEEHRYLIIKPKSEAEILKAGCVCVNHIGPDELLGRCVGGFEGWVTPLLGLKMQGGDECVKDEGAPSAYAWHRDAMAIATRRRAPDEGFDDAFLSGDGLGFQVSTCTLDGGSPYGAGLLVRLSVLMGLEILDPSLITIFQDLHPRRQHERR